MAATIVEGKALLQSVVAALVAGVGITIVFSFAIWGAARFAELSRAERRIEAAGAAAVTLVSLALTLGAVVLSIVVMAKK